ncbi:MAG: TIGR01777 family oxidoreductase [Myxococcales bacterium]
MDAHVFLARSPMPAPAGELFAWHTRPGALERLLPPWQRIDVVSRRGGLADRGRVEVDLHLGPLPVRWVAQHTGYVEGEWFRDEQLEGPFDAWVHTHRVSATGPETSVLEDHVAYRLPAEPPGGLAVKLAERELGRMFAYRHRVTAHDLRRHRAFAAHGPQRIAISGASGLVGEGLRAYLSTAGHEVLRLVRRREDAPDAVHWDPAAGSVDRDALEGLDALIHLAGENVGARWTASRKQAIRESRVRGTRLLCEALASLRRPPRVLLAASAVGFYGDRGDEALDERSAPGDDFLAGVCREWEDATAPARDAGIRVVNLRIGMVLTPRGGALARMLPAFRLGGGGPIGSGRQWMSWITYDDLLAAFEHALFDERVQGPVNVSAPTPVSNRDFASTLGRVLHRPAVVPVPAAAVRLAFGEMGQALVLAGARVLPRALQATGFRFGFDALEPALRHLLGAERLENAAH